MLAVINNVNEYIHFVVMFDGQGEIYDGAAYF